MKLVASLLAFAALSAAQVAIPDGTKIRVRLDQSISSGTAEQGQTVELSVVEAIHVNEQVVIPEGSRVTGTITEAHEKRNMGRAGKLDFSIDRVRGIDNEWIPLRYTVNKKSGESHATRTGVITAGAAIVFWPAAPVFLLMKGKDVTINKGVTFDTFTDQDHVIGHSTTSAKSASPNTPGTPSGTSAVAVTSNLPGADIEVDGAYVGSTPTTVMLATGIHQIAVKAGSAMWQRNLQVSTGSTITVNATLERAAQAVASRR
jgi:hypothetical protein